MQTYRLIVAPVTLAFFFLFAFGPIEVTLASVRSSQSQAFSLVGPKQHYLGLGDSLAFGYQPNSDFNHGYVDYFFRELQGDGVKTVTNMGCPGETSSTMINGNCPSGRYTPLSTPGMKFGNVRAQFLMPVHRQVRPETGAVNCPPTLSISLLND